MFFLPHGVFFCHGDCLLSRRHVFFVLRIFCFVLGSNFGKDKTVSFFFNMFFVLFKILSWGQISEEDRPAGIRNKAECQTSMGEDLQVVPRLQMSAGREWGDLCFVRPGHKDRRGRGSATDARVDSEENAEERMFPVLRVSPISKKQCNRVLVARTQSIVTASACFIDKNSITHQQDQSKDTVRTCTFNSRFWDTAVMVGQ